MTERMERMLEAALHSLWEMFAVDCPEKWPEEQEEASAA